LSANLRGMCVILATPFDQQKRIDEGSLRSLISFELNAGVHGITILGALGEVLRLSDAERQQITRITLDEVKGRVPVVAGTGANGTDLAVMYSKQAEEQGVDALMVAPPRVTNPSDETLLKYYSDIAKEVSIPIVVQDEPMTYPVHMSPKLIARLSEIKNIEYVKLEDPPTPVKISQIRDLIDDRLAIFGGLGGLYALEELLRGAVGMMTGFAYPEVLVKVYDAFSNGKTDTAREIFFKALPLIRYEAQAPISVAIRKEIFKKRGVIANSDLREPAAKLDQRTLTELNELISATGMNRFASDKLSPK